MTFKSIVRGAALLVCSAIVAMASGASAQQKVEATLSTPNSREFSIVRLEQLFADKLKEKTNGNMVVAIVTDGQLGGMKESIEAVMAGNLEMCQVNNAFLNSVMPETALFDLPFIFRDNDHMHHVVRGPIGQGVYGRLEQQTGLRIMMAGIADGPRSVYNRTRPIHTPADLKGLKLRVMESPLMVDTFTTLGALPVPMAFPAIYMAMKQGVIDGAETPPAGLADQKASEVAKYYSLTQHFSSPSSVAVNAKWFDQLPPQYQAAMKEAMADALAWYDALYAEETRKGLDLAKAQGMEVNPVDDLNQFHEAVKPVYQKYGPRVGGLQAIQAVIDTK